MSWQIHIPADSVGRYDLLPSLVGYTHNEMFRVSNVYDIILYRNVHRFKAACFNALCLVKEGGEVYVTRLRGGLA